MQRTVISIPAPPNSAIQTQVQQLYVAYFNRPADAVGLQYWTDLVQNRGVALSAVAAAFATTTEYQDTFRGMNNAEVVNQVYLNLFGRAAEAEGRDFWRDLLDRNAITIDNVVTTIAAGAQGSDAVAYRNKTSAASSFTAALDSPDEIVSYDGLPANLVLKEFLSSITDDASLARNTAPLELQYVLDRIIDRSPIPASHLLTSGADNLMGRDGRNDNFIATDTPGRSVFGADDTLDGKSGLDTLILVSTHTDGYTVPAAKVSNIEIVNVTGNGPVTLDAGLWGGVRNLNLTSKGGAALTTVASANIIVTEQNLATGGVRVDGGNNVTVTVRNAEFGSNGVNIGDTTAPTGRIVVDYAASAVTGTAGNGVIEVNGGSTVVINQSAGSRAGGAAVDAPVRVNGGLNTSSVVVNNEAARIGTGNAGSVQTNSVTITDANSTNQTEGSLHTVVVNNYSTLSLTANALVTLGLGGGSGDVSIVNGGLPGNSHDTLALSLRSIVAGQISDAGVITTLNLATSGSNSSLSNLNMSALTDLNLSGDAHLTLASTTGLTSVARVKVSETAGISGNFSAATFKSFDASATSGNNTVTVDISRADYKGGSGADIVTLVGSGASNNVSLGDGADRVLLQSPGTNLNTYATVLDARRGDAIGFADLGNETFVASKIDIGATATFRDLANAAVARGGDAATNGALAWFQFGNDTYLVESRHNGTTGGFVDGVDMIIRLTGNVDLSQATLVNGVLVLG